MAAPVPIGIVFAFTASRSLAAIADQIAELDAKLDHLRNRPDFVVIFDQGIIGPKVRVRDDFNGLKLPLPEELHHIHKSKRHTLLRFIIQVLDELTPMILPPLDLRSYLRVPDKIGEHLVSGHDRLVRGDERNRVWKLGPKAIRRILEYCGSQTPVLYEEVFKMQFGDVQAQGLPNSSMDQPMKVFNPGKLPPFDPLKLILDKNGRPVYDGPRFNPVFVRIDGTVYAVELSALDEGDLIERTDVDMDELLDEGQLIAVFKQETRRIIEQFSKKA